MLPDEMKTMAKVNPNAHQRHLLPLGGFVQCMRDTDGIATEMKILAGSPKVRGQAGRRGRFDTS
jgi:hypothetical protein